MKGGAIKKRKKHKTKNKRMKKHRFTRKNIGPAAGNPFKTLTSYLANRHTLGPGRDGFVRMRQDDIKQLEEAQLSEKYPRDMLEMLKKQQAAMDEEQIISTK